MTTITSTLIIYKQFNFCHFRALANTNVDRLCAVFLYYICCFHKFQVKKTWWDCVKNGMESLGLSQTYMQSRKIWRRKIKGRTG